MNLSVVGFVVFADFANERHQHSEATTDASHHNLSVHVILAMDLVLVVVAIRTLHQLHHSR